MSVLEQKYNTEVERAINILKQYLSTKHHRFTTERVAILNFIYMHKGHFDANTLYNMMTQENILISRQSVFTTLELLVECNLVDKHYFLKNIAYYEKTDKPHFHQICTNCGAIREFSDEKLMKNIRKKEFNLFNTHHSALYLYGICNKCAKKNAKKTLTTQK